MLLLLLVMLLLLVFDVVGGLGRCRRSTAAADFMLTYYVTDSVMPSLTPLSPAPAPATDTDTDCTPTPKYVVVAMERRSNLSACQHASMKRREGGPENINFGPTLRTSFVVDAGRMRRTNKHISKLNKKPQLENNELDASER